MRGEFRDKLDGVGRDWIELDGNFEIKFQRVKLGEGKILVRVWGKLIGNGSQVGGLFLWARAFFHFSVFPIGKFYLPSYKIGILKTRWFDW
jgi:hypothetical protein